MHSIYGGSMAVSTASIVKNNARGGTARSFFNLAFRSQKTIYTKGLALADSVNSTSSTAISRLISKGSFDAANSIAFKLLTNAKTNGQKSVVCADYVAALVRAKNHEPAMQLAQSLFSELNLDAMELLGKEMGKTSYKKHGFAIAQPFTRDGQIIGVMALKAKRGIAPGQPKAAEDVSLFENAPADIADNEGQLIIFLAKKIQDFKNGNTSSMSAQEIAFVKKCLAKGMETERLATLGYGNKEIADKIGLSKEEVAMALSLAFEGNSIYKFLRIAALSIRTFAGQGLNDEEIAAVAKSELNIDKKIVDAILNFIGKNDASFANLREEGVRIRKLFAELTKQGFSLEAKTHILNLNPSNAEAIEKYVKAFDMEEGAAGLAAKKMSQVRTLALAGFSEEEAGMLSCSIVWENEAQGKTVKKVRELVVKGASVNGTIERVSVKGAIKWFADHDKETVFLEMVELGVSRQDAAKTVTDAKPFYMKPFPDAAILSGSIEDAKKIIRSLMDYDDGHLFNSAPAAAAFKAQLALNSLPVPSAEAIAKIMNLEDGEVLSLELNKESFFVKMKNGELSMFGDPFIKKYDFAQLQLEGQILHKDIEECVRIFGLRTPEQIVAKMGWDSKDSAVIAFQIEAMKIEEIGMQLYLELTQKRAKWETRPDDLIKYLYNKLSLNGVRTYKWNLDSEGRRTLGLKNPNVPLMHELPYNNFEEFKRIAQTVLNEGIYAPSSLN